MKLRYITTAFAVLVGMGLQAMQIDAGGAKGATLPMQSNQSGVTGTAAKQAEGTLNVDFKQISAILNEILPTIVSIAKTTGGEKNAQSLQQFQRVSQGIVDLVGNLDKVSFDLQKAVAAGKDLPKFMTCTKATKKQLTGTSQQAQACIAMGCVDRASCLKIALRNLRILLRPLIDDVLVGYTNDKGEHVQGILLSALDLAQQEKVKKDMEPAVEIIKQVYGLLGEIEKLIVVSQPAA